MCNNESKLNHKLNIIINYNCILFSLSIVYALGVDSSIMHSAAKIVIHPTLNTNILKNVKIKRIFTRSHCTMYSIDLFL
jgi:hypothetical protein